MTTKLQRWMMGMADRTLIQISLALRSPRPIKQAAVILAAAHIFTEVPSILRKAWPVYWSAQISPYLSPWFHMQVERCWYFKDITEDICWVATFYAASKIALQYSISAFLIFFIYLCYHVVDGLFYLWNFKQSHTVYWDLLWYAIILNKLAISPGKSDNLAKIKSLF